MNKIPPPQPAERDLTRWGRTFIYDGLAQTDIDMAFFRLLNLDTTNLPAIGIPPTVHPPPNQWLHDWDGINHIWTATQPRFQDIANYLTSDQMIHINTVGTVRSGVWALLRLLPTGVLRSTPCAPLNNQPWAQRDRQSGVSLIR
jgi:hypothetical protein